MGFFASAKHRCGHTIFYPGMSYENGWHISRQWDESALREKAKNTDCKYCVTCSSHTAEFYKNMTFFTVPINK
jgi:hypothetical protein